VLGKGAREAAVDRTADRPTGRGERRVAAWIGASIVIKGDLVSSEDTTLAGRVEGNVECRDHALVIAEGARVEGNVHARSVSLSGEVTGNVTAEQTIDIGQTGSVNGDIVAPRMSIAEGGSLNGRVTIARSAVQSR